MVRVRPVTGKPRIAELLRQPRAGQHVRHRRRPVVRRGWRHGFVRGPHRPHLRRVHPRQWGGVVQWRLPLGPGHGVRAEGAHANLPFSSSRLVQTGWVAEVGGSPILYRPSLCCRPVNWHFAWLCARCVQNTSRSPKRRSSPPTKYRPMKMVQSSRPRPQRSKPGCRMRTASTYWHTSPTSTQALPRPGPTPCWQLTKGGEREMSGSGGTPSSESRIARPAVVPHPAPTTSALRLSTPGVCAGSLSRAVHGCGAVWVTGDRSRWVGAAVQPARVVLRFCCGPANPPPTPAAIVVPPVTGADLQPRVSRVRRLCRRSGFPVREGLLCHLPQQLCLLCSRVRRRKVRRV